VSCDAGRPIGDDVERDEVQAVLGGRDDAGLLRAVEVHSGRGSGDGRIAVAAAEGAAQRGAADSRRSQPGGAGTSEGEHPPPRQ